jgi:hypothetical protein
MKIKKNNIIIPDVKTKIDLLKYQIINQKFPFEVSLYRLYVGDLESCIQHFESRYGNISVIYYDEVKKIIGFINGSQVIKNDDQRHKE